MTIAAVFSLTGVAQAQTAPKPVPTAAERQAAIDTAWQQAGDVAVRGPAPITLRDEAVLQMPAGEAFVPQTQTAQLLKAWGNTTDDSLAGMIVGINDNDHWSIIVRFIKEGYIKDDDTKDWNADDMLKSLREGTEASNHQRALQGFPELDIIGWVEPPAYDATTHRLVWSLSAQDRGAATGRPHTINYNTYALGRDGYFSLNLLTNSAEVEANKPVVRTLLGSLDYNPGKRYGDFVESTDKVAAYGLAALIGVVAVKKIGLLAGLGIFLIKIWKVGLLAIAGIGAAIRRFFKRTPSAGE